MQCIGRAVSDRNVAYFVGFVLLKNILLEKQLLLAIDMFCSFASRNFTGLRVVSG